MKKIVVVNAGPRKGWNTDLLLKEAAKGAEAAGAEAVFFDLYKLPEFTGCVSCFGCKKEGNLGRCVCRDGLYDVLEAIRNADGLIIGTPNYLGDATAAFRALYERLIFQYITYSREVPSYSGSNIPVLLVMTSNVAAEQYAAVGYDKVLERYRSNFERFIGPTETFVCGDTLQVSDYSKFNWSIFDPAHKQKRREEVFPLEKQQVFDIARKMAE